MEKIIEKAGRLQRPRNLAVQLRPDVYEWLYDVGLSFGGKPSPATVARALLEDAYDLNEIYRAINAEFFEQVSLRIPGIVILIDEVGKVIDPPKAHNELASRLYGGYEFGDDIVGPALFFKQVGPDIAPLDPTDEARLSLFLGVKLPEKN